MLDWVMYCKCSMSYDAKLTMFLRVKCNLIYGGHNGPIIPQVSMMQTFLINSGKTALDRHHKQRVYAKRPTFKSRDRPMFKQRHCFLKIVAFPRIALRRLTINQTCTSEISLLLISAIDIFLATAIRRHFEPLPLLSGPHRAKGR